MSRVRRARETVVVAGSLAQKPNEGGHTWQFLQYLLGFRRLGHDVLFIDRTDEDVCGGPVEVSRNATYLRQVMERFGLGDSWALLHDGRSLGLSRAEVLRRVRSSTVLINVMGFLDDEEALSAAPLRVFLDTDPGYGQMWQDLGLAEPFRDHDVYVTIAENIGRDECTLPTCGIDWVTTAQPVLLEEWAPTGTTSSNGAFTSIGAWRGPYGPIEYEGQTYGLRVHEFRKFVELPDRTDAEFELALDIHPDETADLQLLEAHRWRLVDPRQVARDPDVYRDYVRRSCAEFMVARGMYVTSRCGWFSERSMCYLAGGKPVLAQDTGIRKLYPTGEGLVIFSTLEEAVAGVEAIRGDYERHSRAARELAEEYFDSNKVLTRLLEKLGVA
jgi:hypothetical protein